MERVPKQKNELLLPRGYSIPELRSMSDVELATVCETDGLELVAVQTLLGRAIVGEKKNDTFEITPIHPDQEFIGRVLEVYARDEYQINSDDLESIPRDRTRGERSETKAYQLLTEYENTHANITRKHELRREIRALFNDFVLQEALFQLDTYLSQGNSYTAALHKVYVNFFRSGIYKTNVPILGDVYDRMARKFFPRRAGNAALQREATDKFVALLEKQQDGRSTDSENAQIATIIRAIKGVYQRGSTTISVPAEYEAALPEMVDYYKKTRPKNSMSPGSVQGSDVYEAGVYADNAYSRGHRPRRYGDGLGSN